MNTGELIPMVVYVSDSFTEIFESHFYQSFVQLGLGKGFALMKRKPCIEPGDFGTMAYQIHLVAARENCIEVLQENKGKVVVLCGADIRFYRSDLAQMVRAHVTDENLWMMRDVVEVGCPDFMACKSCDETIRIFIEWVCEIKRGKHDHDQHCLNDPALPFNSRLRFFPETLWTHGIASDGPGIWDGKNVAVLPNPPYDIHLHHANFTVGVKNKLALLDEIRRRVEARKK